MKRLMAVMLCGLMLCVSGCGSREAQGEPVSKTGAQNTTQEESAQTEDSAQIGESAQTEDSANTGESAQTVDRAKTEGSTNPGENTDAGKIARGEEATDDEKVVTDSADGHETAQAAVENMRIGWNLGNSFDATGEWITLYTEERNEDFETSWGNPVTQKSLMPKLKELGFQAVRIPITWNYHFDEDGNIDESWLARIQEVVDWAMEEELYCIINIHHDTGADGWLRASTANYEENRQIFQKLWTQIAARFKDYPDKLLFEGFNEMLDEQSEWNNPGQDAIDAVNNYNQCFVDAVRATGGNNLTRNLICCTYAAATSGNCMKSFKVPEDSTHNHLIAEVHFYNPYEFITDEGITWTTPINEYTDYVESAIDGVFQRIEQELGAKNVPIIIGEFACDDKGNTNDRVKWYTHVIEKANEQGITCFVWDNGNGYNMGHIDRVGEEDAFPEIIQACVETAK